MAFGDSKSCPGLNVNHGFLQNINQRLIHAQTHEQMWMEKEENSERKSQKKSRRPSIELYSIPARRRTSSCQLDSVVENHGSDDRNRRRDLNQTWHESRNDAYSGFLESQLQDITVKCNHTNVRKVSLTDENHENCSCHTGALDFFEVRGHEDGCAFEENSFSRAITKTEEKYSESVSFKSQDAETRNSLVKSPVTVSDLKISKLQPQSCNSESQNFATDTSQNCPSEHAESNNPQRHAQKVLKKLLKRKPKEGQLLYFKTLDKDCVVNEGPTILSQSVSAILVEAVQDPANLYKTDLRRIAEVLVRNSCVSHLYSYRMRYIAMVLIQKEEKTAKSDMKGRFVEALLEEFSSQHSRNQTSTITTDIPFLSFVMMMYFCEIFHASARVTCALLIYNLVRTCVKDLSDVSKAEQLFFLLHQAGPLLETDIPSQLSELYVTIKDRFLSDGVDEKIKDVLLDSIETKAAGWKLL